MSKQQQLQEKKVLVLGLGLSGQAAAHFLLKRKALVVGVDRQINFDKQNDKIAHLCDCGMVFLHEENVHDLETFALVVVSPGVPMEHPIYKKALDLGLEVIGEMELACREITQKCLAITGTNGKTTVTLMTTHILEQAGIKAKALGNVGVPLTSAIDLADDTDVFVIELSSFQLDTLTTRFIDAGVILNITPDHLDRYLTMEAYASSKMGIEKNLKEGVLFAEERCLKEFSSHIKQVKPLSYGYSSNNYIYVDGDNVYCDGQKIFTLPKCYQGKHTHDVENILASCALCSTLSITPESFLKGLNSFKKPPHRIEFVKSISGVAFYDDSKGTNIDAVIRAVEGLDGKIVLIAGGMDKGFPYTTWIEAFNKKVKAICAVGQSKEKIKNDLGADIPVILFTDFEKAIHHAASLAESGENVLLSPGCSSLDMFKDYAHRGQEFQRIVKAII